LLLYSILNVISGLLNL